jgi:Uma2 family endonuclease
MSQFYLYSPAAGAWRIALTLDPPYPPSYSFQQYTKVAAWASEIENMPLLSLPAEQRVVLSNVSWETFEGLSADNGVRGGRMAYEEGSLEIMSPSREHEMLKSVLGRLVDAYAQEMGIDIAATGSTTLKLELKKRGLEPDESYYIQNEAAMRGRVDLDLERDPPPDLAIEVEITRSALDKLGIYAALGVAMEAREHDPVGD